jgi:hypothetical protein
MRKTNIVLIIALGMAALAGLAFHQVSNVSAQGDSVYGVVVAYTPGVSITVVDQKGNQIEYTLDAAVKIESANGEITVGSVVTIVAPASLDKGKQKAVGIVVHPEKELLPSETPRVKDTALPTEVEMTKTPKVSETPTPVDIFTVTPTGTLTATPPPSANAKDDGSAAKANPFIEWLRSLFQQVLSQ